MKLFKRLAVASASLVTSLSMTVAPVAAATTTVYDATPSVLPANVDSLGFQATSTTEFGDYVHLAGTNRELNTVTVTMSNWALAATPANVTFCAANITMCTAEGYLHPITVNVYEVIPGPTNVKGAILATLTREVAVPWRPAEDPTNCPTKTNPGYAYKWQSIPGAADTNCSNGLAFNAAFDMSSLDVILPNDVIVGVSYKTQSYGSPSLGIDGPYNSLNVGIAMNQTASVGMDDSADKLFWDTTYPTYTAGFKEDFGWTPNGTVNIKITVDSPAVAVPTNKDQCKGNGWEGFNGVFKNQGDCVSYVATAGRNKPALGTF